MSIFNTPTPSDPTVLALRNTLTAETSPLAARFRALFSLKHLACQSPPTDQTIPALEAIAAALVSPSALLKHELAYCLGQSGKPEAVGYLEACVEDRAEDPMCRHEAAEALGALGFDGSLELLKARRDDKEELEVVRETAELAVERIEWAASEAGKAEKLRTRYVYLVNFLDAQLIDHGTVTSRLLTLRLRSQKLLRLLPSRSSKRPSSTHLSRCSSATGRCLHSATSLRRPTFRLPFLPYKP
jgi:HEAT repeat protein